MKKHKLLYTVLMAAALAASLLLSGCSDDSGQAYAYVLATASPEDTVTQIFAEAFVSTVKELSDGEIEIEIYSNSSLGSDTELFESVTCGDIPFVIQNTAPQVSYLPRLCLFDLPMVFDDIEDLHVIMDTDEFIDKVNDIYAEKGITLLSMSDQNFRVMSSNVKVESLEDFSGIKIRTMENSYHMAFWTAIGANPTPMSFSEVYIGLQQNTIDAQENPYEVIVSNKFYEQQDYIIQTNHLPHILTLITNTEFMESLPEEDQEILTTAAAYASQVARMSAEDRVEERIEICEEGGAEIVSLSDELIEEMRAACTDLYEEIREVVADDDLYNMYIGAE